MKYMKGKELKKWRKELTENRKILVKLDSRIKKEGGQSLKSFGKSFRKALIT